MYQAIGMISLVIVITIVEGRKVIQIEDTFAKIELDLRMIYKNLES
jgi:hypothetical protein